MARAVDSQRAAVYSSVLSGLLKHGANQLRDSEITGDL